MKTVPVLVFALTSAALATAIAPVVGQNWVLTSAPSTNWSCVASSADGTKLVAAVDGGLVYISTNSGGAWVETTSGADNWAALACSADGTKLLAASALRYLGDTGMVYRSTDSGATWMPTGFGQDNWHGVASSADGSTLAAAGGLCKVSTNSGANWSYLVGAILTSSSFPLVASSSDGTIMAVLETYQGDQHSELITTPSYAWEPQGPIPDFYGLCTSLALTADGAKFAACINIADRSIGAVTNCGGVLFTSLVSGTPQFTSCTSVSNWTSVASSANGIRLAAVASSGDVYTSTNGGVTWTPNTVTNASWSGVASSADGAKLVAVANGGGIYTWQTTPTPMLTISRAGEGLQISWLIPSMNFVLQQSADLTSTNWTAVESTPILNLTNLQNQITMTPPTRSMFYRLSSRAP